MCMAFVSSTYNQPSLTCIKGLTPSPCLLPRCLHCFSLKLLHRCESWLSHSWAACSLPARTAALRAPGFRCLLILPAQRRNPGSSMPCMLFTSPVSHPCMAFSCFHPPPLFPLPSSLGFPVDPTAYEALGLRREHILIASPLFPSPLCSFTFPEFFLREFVASSTLGSHRAWLLKTLVLESDYQGPLYHISAL